MASSQASQVHSMSSSPSTTFLPETVLQASPCQRLTENKAVMDVVIEARSLYQVAAPVLSTTAAGDVTFIGMPNGSAHGIHGESLICVKGRRGVWRRLVEDSTLLLIQRRILLRELTRE
jgi:hypothetical protein